MDTQQKYSLSGAIITVSCFLLLAGACDNSDRLEMDTQAEVENVLLNFNASTTSTVTTGTRGMNPIENFSKSSYVFGLSVTKNGSGSATFPGSDNMKATMTRKNGRWDWAFTNNADNPVTPQGPTGKPLKIKAYYDDSSGNGLITGDAFTHGIPFDLTQTNNPVKTEILYNTDTLYTIPSSGADGEISLKFQHAYSMIIIEVTKYIDKGAYNLSGVSIENLSGGKWIKNKGRIDPATGLAMKGAEAGPIGEVKALEPLPLTSSGTFITYEFLVPSFMDAGVGDQTIAIVLVINGKREVFALQRAHLNQLDGKYGFRQGYKNKYKLEFNNSSLNLRLLDWISYEIGGEFGGSASAGVGYQTVDYVNYDKGNKAFWLSGLTKPLAWKGSDVEYPYDSYLTTVAYGGNGVYIPAKPKQVGNVEDDENVAASEAIRTKFQFTKENVVGVVVPWADENGVLTAKDICRNYRGNNKKDWRLPRASELRAIFGYLVNGSGNASVALWHLNFKQGDYDKLYWTGTEVDRDNAWAMSYSLGVGPQISPCNKRSKCYVRCIRDFKE